MLHLSGPGGNDSCSLIWTWRRVQGLSFHTSWVFQLAILEGKRWLGFIRPLYNLITWIAGYLWVFHIATPMLQLLIRGSRFGYPGDCPTPSISAFKILEIRSVLLTNLMLSDVCLQFVRVLSSSAHSDYCQDVDIFFRFGRHEVWDSHEVTAVHR